MTVRLIAGCVAVMLLAATAGPSPAAAGEERIAPAPAIIDVIEAFAARLKVGPPDGYRNLALFPVFAGGAAAPRVDLTLDEAMELGLLEIRELKSAEVNRVRLLSKADDPVFIMGGEMLGGAKQDRIVGDDLIVPAGADLVVPVFCVEHGRWVVKTETFGSAKTLASSAVRQARASADQSAVWERVAEEQERLEAPSATGAMRSIKDSRHVQDKVRPYLRALSDFADDNPGAQGVVACVAGRIIAADLFGSRSLFRALWPKLLESYVIDAIDRHESGVRPDAVQIRRWLHGLQHAEQTGKKTPGDGRLYQLRGSDLLGSALTYGRAVVHVELFKTYIVRPATYNRLEFRRERLEQEQTPEEQR